MAISSARTKRWSWQKKPTVFFLLNAHNISTAAGDIVINNVGPVSKRSGFLVEETVRRYGFDVRFNFVRVDEMQTTNILHVNLRENAHS